ncbi:hypothetical protein WJX72_000011 [[Myrmecia] bisecta]|uniref:GMP phosphodiesterase delta subunit domain-containing protein n=1 Tax=[Myrmecia] bisecta TaxID=41462 RepID=A0AAW1P309_9CHLO
MVAGAPPVTPEHVLQHRAPAPGYLCPLSANTYDVEFVEFEIRDYETGASVFKVSRPPGAPPVPKHIDPALEDQVRQVRYAFPEEFLRAQGIRTALKFKVGDEPVPDFRMIERHYFQGELLRSFDFNFGFCIPNSTNTWEAVYPMPENSPARIKALVASPYAHVSDSFYFSGQQLIMHNKAQYRYVPTGP